jgi:MFS transporter, NRE family, putaive nickel resistance protein
VLQSLRNNIFARLYAAQTISLLGDALTWLGLALLAVELAGDRAPAILATALTCRIIAFIICAPIAGIIADKFDRKLILIGTHLVRMVLVGLLPFVQNIWQLYAIVLFLNIFHAFFTPTYQSTIPFVTEPQEYAPAMALASVTYQTLSIVGPGLAGIVAGWLGARAIFWLDSGSFFLAAVVMLTIHQPLNAVIADREIEAQTSYFSKLTLGTRLLFGDQILRYAVSIQLIGAIVGAQILVNTVGYVRVGLNLGDREYGWVMMAFGLGTVIGAFLLAATRTTLPRYCLIFGGGILMVTVMLFAHAPSLQALILLWLLAGIAQNSINLPTQIEIGDRIPRQHQGQVYAAHFAWSHLWFGFAYPLAGWLGTQHPQSMFPIAGGVGMSILIVFQLWLGKGATKHEHSTIEHTHFYWHQHHEHHHRDRT